MVTWQNKSVFLHFHKTYKNQIWGSADLGWGPPFFQVTCFFCYVVLRWHLTKEKPGILYSARPITINFDRMLTYFEVLSLTRHISLRSIGHLRSRNKIKKVISPLPKSLYISDWGSFIYQIACPSCPTLYHMTIQKCYIFTSKKAADITLGKVKIYG